MKKNDACIEDNMHDKEGGVLSFLKRIFTLDPYDALNGAGMVAPHTTPRSIEELADALKPEDAEDAHPCPEWMRAY
jgi:hypothetical protein